MPETQYLEILAKETLGVFQRISKAALSAVESSPTDTSNALVSGNSMVGSTAVSNLEKNTAALRKGHKLLSREPAILRLVAKDESGDTKTYFISRSTPASSGGELSFASYRSSIGKLGAMDPGDEISLDIAGKPVQFHLIEKTVLAPSQIQEKWDSAPNFYEHEDDGAFTVESMLALLDQGDQADAETELELLLQGENTKSNIIEGFAHQVRHSMSLRDQPILDKIQDSIFRMPLDSQLFILGPPGTGKTTTLIKRLGLKLDKEYLGSAEKLLALDDPAGLPHEQSWLMFTPTELLKQYVKEAFSREQIPASNERIQTWETYRNHLARNVLGLLQSTTTKGKFILKPTASYLGEEAQFDPREWFDAFRAFHIGRLITQLNSGLKLLSSVGSDVDSELQESISSVVETISDEKILPGYEKLTHLESEISPRIKTLKTETDTLIRKGLAFQFNRNAEFLPELSSFVKTLEVDEESDFDGEFDDEVGNESSAPNRNNLQQAEQDYTRAIRSIARFTFLSRNIPTTSKASAIKTWLGERLPSEDQLQTIGKNIAIQNGLRRFIKPMRRIVTDVPSSFREFRKQCIQNKSFYIAQPEKNSHISSSELDAVVHLTLKSAGELLSQRYIARIIEEPSMNWLKIIESQFRNQVLVDEVADFSALQLGAMFNLTKGSRKSFFSCGDFNQRIVSSGVRSLEQIQWACPGIKSQTITTVYRQSRRLNEFAKLLLEVTGGDQTALGELPKNHSHIGFAPVLIEDCSGIENVALWLFERIREVEMNIRKMPTIAVLVNSEDEVKPMAEKLTVHLEEISLRAMPCSEGQALGERSDIRVFDVQHIKGLEFEAVFFVNIDQLAELKPDIFDKYLYVGATRAATYLGVSSSGKIPGNLEDLRAQFVDSW